MTSTAQPPNPTVSDPTLNAYADPEATIKVTQVRMMRLVRDQRAVEIHKSTNTRPSQLAQPKSCFSDKRVDELKRIRDFLDQQMQHLVSQVCRVGTLDPLTLPSEPCEKPTEWNVRRGLMNQE
jgi:hypothetical protein